MAPNETQDPEQTPPTITPDASPEGLPFEYEDLSDGRHQRLIAEIEAARIWTLRRRAQGLRPS